MFYGKVIGTVVTSVKSPKLNGYKLLVIQKVNHLFNPEEEVFIAIDFVQAGLGDYVYLAKSKDAALPMEDRNSPIDASVVGIIDSIHLIEGEAQ